MKNSGKALLGVMLQYKEAKTSNRFPCLFSEGGCAGSLYGVRVVWVQSSDLRGGLGGSPTRLGAAVYTVHAQYPAFAPSFSEVTFGFLFLLVSYCSQFAPTAHAHSYC